MDLENLQERITIKSEVETKQANGEITTTLQDVATVWASAMPISGNESYDGNVKIAQDNYRFLIRYRTDVSVTDVIEFDNKLYDIRSINRYYKEGRNNFLELKTQYAEQRF